MTVPTAHALGEAILSGLLLGGLFALTALGLSLVLGVMRLMNLAHGEIVVAGAYAGFYALDRLGIEPLVTMVLLVPAVGLVAYPLQRVILAPALARSAEAPLLTTFGLSIIAQNLYVLFFSGDTRAISRGYATAAVTVGGFTVPAIYAIGFGVSVIVVLALQVLVQRTSFGRDMRSSAEDPEAASVVGVRVPHIHALAFALGAAIAAMGGVLVGLAFSFTPTTGLTYLLTGFAVVVLGGLGSVVGTLVGGIALGVAEAVGASFFGDGYRDFIGLVLLLIVLVVRPQGLLGRRSR